MGSQDWPDKKFAGLTLMEIAKTHKDSELVKALAMEIVYLSTELKIAKALACTKPVCGDVV